MKPPAVLLGGGLIALPVARSLARAGVQVIAAGFHTDPVRWSRYCGEFVDLGAGEGVQERWREWLAERRVREEVLLPCSDDALELIARHRTELVALGYRPIEADDELILAMLDKQRTYELARGVQVAAPMTVPIGPGDDPAEALDKLDFPFALKPRRSHLFAREFGLSQKAFVARDRRELAERCERMRQLGIEMLASEIIPGPDDAYRSYYSLIDERGEPLFHLTKRKLRQYPPGFGLATYHQLDRDPEVAELGLRFFRGIGIRGMANVEFKRDERSGELVLIECNHRFTAAQELIRYAGLDLALLVYDRLAGQGSPPLGDYRAGARMWLPVEDLRAFLELRRSGKLGLGGWLRSLPHRQHFPLFSWRDPQPSLRSWARLARRAGQRRSRAATASAT